MTQRIAVYGGSFDPFHLGHLVPVVRRFRPKLVFYLAGSVGLLRLPDLYSRLHALTKADNLGLGLLLLLLLEGGLRLLGYRPYEPPDRQARVEPEPYGCAHPRLGFALRPGTYQVTLTVSDGGSDGLGSSYPEAADVERFRRRQRGE